MYSKLK
jgi:hypothetical protein